MPKKALPEEERKRRRKISIEKYKNSLKYKIANAAANKRYYNKNKEKWKQYRKTYADKQNQK